jgi:hypothetical protein
VRFISEPIHGFKDFPQLGGFIRTTPKQSPLVEVPIVTPLFAEQKFPVLAHWHYGLGKSVAFTSDAGGNKPWSKDWMDKGVFAPFWEQVLAWSLRPTESGKLRMHAEVRDGKVRIVVEAKDEEGKPVTDLKLRGGLTTPGGKDGPGGKKELRFTQKAGGTYEAEVKADEAGSYFVAAQAVRKVKRIRGGKEVIEEERDGVRAGVTLPYSPEFSELETNEELLERVRAITHGERYFDDAEILLGADSLARVFREPETRARFSLPFHYWLLFLAAALLLADVAVRRIAFDANETAETLNRLWLHLRGLPIPPQTEKSADRLTAKAGDARRYEGAPGMTLPPQGPPRPVRPTAGGVPEAKAEEPAEDTMEALRRAKKKLWDKKEGE